VIGFIKKRKEKKLKIKKIDEHAEKVKGILKKTDRSKI